MKTPISYYGGKQQMLKHILPLIPSHVQYVEPFLGGGAVFWAKPKSHSEVLNDQNEWVTNFFRVLKTDFDALNEMILGTALSEVNHKKALSYLKNEATDLQKAWGFWVRTNASFGCKITAGIKVDTLGHAAKTIAYKRNEFYKYQHRLDHVMLYCRDALSVISLRDTTDTFFYLDPPYINADQGHYAGYTKDDFIALLELLTQLKGKFLLSSYPSDVLTTFIDRNSWRSLKYESYLSITSHRKQNDKKIECLTYNYDCPQTDLFF